MLAGRRVAFVAPYLPAPEDTGGRIRMARLARALVAEGARVELFACGGRAESSSPRAIEAMSVFAERTIRGRKPSMMALSTVPERVKSATPVSLAWAMFRAHREGGSRPFDAVVVSHSYAMGLADERTARGAAVVLDEHNVESDYARSTAGARGADAQREAARLCAWERACWRRADAVTCVSAADARSIADERAGLSAPCVVQNGVVLERVRFRPPSERARSNEVLFVGLMSFGPNEEGAEFLAKSVMPIVWRTRPDARLVLCGRQPSERVRALASQRVAVTGTVENVGEYLDRAAVVTVPLAHGAGSSLKAVEALASGAAVVSTSVGFRGIDGAEASVTHREADDPQAFAAALIDAMNARGSGAEDERAKRARALGERFDWAALGARFSRVVAEAIDARARARAAR